MAEKERISYIRPDGVEVALHDEQTVKLGGWMGFGVDAGAVDYRVPYRHGRTFEWLYAKPRRLEVVLAFFGDYSSRRQREEALMRSLQVFAGLGAVRVIRPDGTARRIPAVLAGWGVVEGQQNTLPGRAVRNVTFYAPDPFFQDDEPEMVNSPISEEPPQSFPRSFPLSWGGSNADVIIELQNAGDVETWPVIRITGPADHPIVTNETTGKKVDVAQSQDAGDYVEIDMGAGTVTWYDASSGQSHNALAAVSDDSEFFPLVVGANRLHISVQNAGSGTVSVVYYQRYVTA